MGLFKFIKEAGAKIFGGSAAAATPEKLQQEVQGHGFDANKLGIQVDGDKVKLSGQAVSQEEAEKIILSLGNTYGVAEVDTSGPQDRSSPRPNRPCTRSRRATPSGRSPRSITARARAPNTRKSSRPIRPPVKDPDMIQPGWVLRIPPLA